MYFYIFQFFIVVFLSCILSYLGVRTKKGTPIVLLLFCIIAIAIGTRVNIGGDYRNYCQIIPFLNDSDFGFGNRFSIEYGFALICKIGKFLGNDVFWFFFLSALITVYLFFNLYREQKILLPVGIFIFFLSLPFGFVINGVRQGVAIFAFLNAITSASKQESISFKGFIVYLFWIILGASFHSATLVFIPVYFLTGKKILNLFNWWILVVIALSGLVINQVGELVGFSLDSELRQYSQLLRYFADDRFVVEKGDFGLGTYLTVLFYIVPLLFYDKVAAFFPKSRVFFALFAFGIGIKYCFPSNMFVTRVAYYMMFAEVLVYPYLFRYLAMSRKTLIPITIVCWYILLYFFDFGEFVINQIHSPASFLGINVF